MTRKVALVLAVVLGAVGCGGRTDVFADRTGAAERGATLPAPVPAVPVFVIETQRPLTDDRIRELAEIEGVAVIAPVSVRRVSVEGVLGPLKLRVAEVDPLVFRSVAPPATRDADFVWVSMIVGQAVPTFDASRRLGLAGAGEIFIAGTRFSVGAFADNSVPNLADVMLQKGDEKRLELGDPTVFVVGAKSGVTIESLGRDLRDNVRGAHVRRLAPQAAAPAEQDPNAAPQPVGYISGGVVGAMRFEILPNGFIRPDPAWVSANIVDATVPILGTVRCHRIMIPRLTGALQAIADAGLANLIRTGDYGGCYVPRFIDRDPGGSLSNHAFGLAIDLNVSTNRLGTRGDMDPRIVEIFRKWGFAWGGYWSRPDPMHFEVTN